MVVHINHSGPGSPCSVQRQLQEMLGGNQISVGRQHEIDGVPGRVDSAIQVHPLCGYTNIGLVHPPGSIRMPSFPAKPLIQNGA